MYATITSFYSKKDLKSIKKNHSEKMRNLRLLIYFRFMYSNGFQTGFYCGFDGTSIAHWIKNPLQRKSKHNHEINYRNFQFFFTRKNHFQIFF